MHNTRNLRLRVFAFLTICGLLFSTGSLTAPDPQGSAVQRQAEPSNIRQVPSPIRVYIDQALPTPKLPEPTGLTYPEVLQQRNEVLAILQAHLGTPYVYGGAWPGGFDCSGIIYYIYQSRLGYPITRCADTQLLYDGVAVDAQQLQLGDLVFFRDPGSPWAASHAGSYVGDGQMIPASSSKGLSYASIHSSYFSSRYVGAKRIIQPDTSVINPDISGLHLR